MDSTSCLNFLFIGLAFSLQIDRVTVQNLNIFRQNINVFEKVVPHKVMVRFRVVPRKVDVFVHVECLYISERDTALFMEFDQLAIHAKRSAS